MESITFTHQRARIRLGDRIIHCWVRVEPPQLRLCIDLRSKKAIEAMGYETNLKPNLNSPEYIAYKDDVELLPEFIDDPDILIYEPR